MREPENPRTMFVVCLGVTILLALTALVGCAVLPMPFQPETQDNSNMAEGTFLVLAGADTAQLMRCEPHPGRTLGISLAAMTVHTFVASWLDDMVAQQGGAWAAGRSAFHVVSIGIAGGDVTYNQLRGCRL